MKTILVPTDLSPMTPYALDVAVGLARTYQAEIILLHTVLNELAPIPDPVGGFTYDLNPVYQEAWNEAKEALCTMAANPAYAGVTIKKKLGSNIEGLIRCITEQPADLIVLASKGASGLREWLEGSHAELIVRHASCPVLVVKQPLMHFNPQHSICGIDLDEKLMQPHTYPFLLTSQQVQQFVYVLTPTDSREPEGIQQWMADYAQVQGISPYQLTIKHDKTVPDGILQYAEKVKADLVVLFTHGHTGLRHWIEGSVAEDVLNHASMSVLIMRL
ncbi:universal stress protein [Spirosoma sp. HMF4905]|uniref:Universal stress protein n=1 Tax=Spirosoma arboris TaxID=2682092 RepID=A0A7K1SJH9_9BACT|nr:universal stress protein [Spirosoma arboris]MVM33935.1 universal stress protein [Spirosoma arboris]